MSDNPFVYQPLTSVPVNRERNKKFIDIIQGFVLVLAVLVIVYLLFAIPTQVDGQSMEPTYQNDEIMISNRLIQIIGGPNGLLKSYDYQRGDLVVFKKGNLPDLIKRIVGLPGEKIMIKGQKVYINGNLLDESAYNDPALKPTISGDYLSDGIERIIPDGQYAVLGDNRINSKDSRFSEVGFIKREEIKASPFILIFPLNRAQGIVAPEYR